MSSGSAIRISLSRSAWLAVSLGFAAALLTAAAPAAGQDPVIRVEEDWKLVLLEPNNAIEAPQFNTVMSPQADLSWYYALVTWNYRELPEFGAGGLQLQSWQGDWRLKRRGVGDALLSTTGETITWTQALDVTDGIMLTFEILNGHSVTWGDFGKDMNISEFAFLPDLGLYDTSVSARNACISYGANRVTLMAITQVRQYGPNGLISVDSKPKVIFKGLDPLIDNGEPAPAQ